MTSHQEKKYLRLIKFSLDLSLKVSRAFTTSNILPNYNSSFTDFLTRHKHEIYHLWTPNTRCCCCTGTISLQSKQLLYKPQFDKMFIMTDAINHGHVKKSNRNKVSQHCVCNIEVKPTCTLDHLDIVIICRIVRNCYKLQSDDDLWLDTISKIRNDLAHVEDISYFQNGTLEYWWQRLEGSVLGLSRKIPPEMYYYEAIQGQVSLLQIADFDVGVGQEILDKLKADNLKLQADMRDEMNNTKETFETFGNAVMASTLETKSQLKELTETVLSSQEAAACQACCLQTTIVNENNNMKQIQEREFKSLKESQSETKLDLHEFKGEINIRMDKFEVMVQAILRNQTIVSPECPSTAGRTHDVGCQVQGEGLDYEMVVNKLKNEEQKSDGACAFKINSPRTGSILLDLTCSPEVLKSEANLRAAIYNLIEKMLKAGNVDINVPGKMDIELIFKGPLTKEEIQVLTTVFSTNEDKQEKYERLTLDDTKNIEAMMPNISSQETSSSDEKKNIEAMMPKVLSQETSSSDEKKNIEAMMTKVLSQETSSSEETQVLTKVFSANEDKQEKYEGLTLDGRKNIEAMMMPNILVQESSSSGTESDVVKPTLDKPVNMVCCENCNASFVCENCNLKDRQILDLMGITSHRKKTKDDKKIEVHDETIYRKENNYTDWMQLHLGILKKEETTLQRDVANLKSLINRMTEEVEKDIVDTEREQTGILLHRRYVNISNQLETKSQQVKYHQLALDEYLSRVVEKQRDTSEKIKTYSEKGFIVDNVIDSEGEDDIALSDRIKVVTDTDSEVEKQRDTSEKIKTYSEKGFIVDNVIDSEGEDDIALSDRIKVVTDTDSENMSRTLEQKRENFYRHSRVIVDETKQAFILLLVFYLESSATTYKTFIENNVHEIYHLCFNQYPCCQCPPGTRRHTKGQRVLHHQQLSKLLDTTGIKLPGHIPGSPSAAHNCCCPVNPTVTLHDLDVTLARVLLVNFTNIVPVGSVERNAIESLIKTRNNSMAHATESKMDDTEYEASFDASEKSLLVLAKVYGKESETRQRLQDIKREPLNLNVCIDLRNNLLKQLDIDHSLKKMGEAFIDLEKIVEEKMIPEPIIKDIENVKVLEGCNACFEIWLKEDNIPVQWFKNRTELVSASNVAFEQKKNIHSLTITNVNLEDKGEYSVKVKDTYRTAILNVEAYYTKNMKEVACKEGDDVLLRYEVTESDMEAQWYKDDFEYQGFTKSFGKCHMLRIPSVKLRDRGRYTIDVNNRQRTTQITVKAHRQPPRNQTPSPEPYQ